MRKATAELMPKILPANEEAAPDGVIEESFS